MWDRGAESKWSQASSCSRDGRANGPQVIIRQTVSVPRQRQIRRTRLRRALEAIPGNPCFLEYVAFDVCGNGFRISARLLGLAAVIRIIGPQTIQRHMRAPAVVPGFEFRAQKRQVVEALDERNTLEPLVLERLDDAFGDSNGPVFSYGSQSWLHAPSA